jgi:hypothetical protein
MADADSNARSRVAVFGASLPGVISWSTAAVTVVCTVLIPRTWLVIVTAFVAYFVGRMTLSFVYSLVGHARARQWSRRDWTRDEAEPGPFGFAPADVHHVVMVLSYREPEAILARTLDALASQHRAEERVILVLGTEARESGAAERASSLIARYAGRFEDAVVSIHPDGIPGEVAGKGSNEAWAARIARARVEELGLAAKLVTITSCDADSVLHAKYFSAVSRLFANDPRRYERFWQAPLFYTNNIWHVPAPVRFTTWLAHAGQLAELAMPFYTPLPVSTYTLSLDLSEHAGWWDPTVIPEDWHEYLRCMFATDCTVGLTAVFLPISADATDGASFWDGMRNRHLQVMRHAWGAEDVGYILGHLLPKRGVWRPQALFRFVQVLHDHVLRVVSWVLLMSAYVLSLLATHQAVRQGRLPRITDLGMLRVFFLFGAVMMAGSVLIELGRCPPPVGVSRLHVVVEIAALWIMLPAIGFYLSMLPALIAQTRLMTGRPLAYRTTPKRLVPSPTTGPG